MEDRTRKLSDEEIAAIRQALAAVLVDLGKKSPMVDGATNDPAILDLLHASFAKERRTAQDVMDLLDEAEEVVVRLSE